MVLYNAFSHSGGRTNLHRLFQTTTTSTKSENKNLRSTSPSSTALIGGVAYGGYARKIVGRIMNSMQALHGHAFIEDHPEHLVMALTEALALVGSMKCYPSS
ncbi:Iron-sulfur-binding 4Fe-4S ferredoxin [Heracleum sosnowskyi]|uniref:Iron-sulfur-binding 4Fe-4S ferredoxin n=1 Tax=Heracleum sosnowskyi TaxID=360622 RepID=A0AAD8HAY3_9APIA|nr:Iron-sulfur-binding 4Fe-4S ferredoxin [Heracleum sosnowskyi]